MGRIRRVCLLIDTSTSWGARIIRGIGRYAGEAGGWLIHVEPRGRYDRFRIPQGWSGDGIIARLNRKTLAEEIRASGLPAVNVSWYPFEGERIVLCTVDERATGRMAAEYFLSCGFQNFGYVGSLQRPGYQDLFSDSFCESLQEHKFKCHLYPAPAKDQDSLAWDVQLASLVQWLEQ